MSVSAIVQSILESSPAITALAGDRIYVVQDRPAPLLPFILHGSNSCRPTTSHDGIAGMEYDYQVFAYATSHSQVSALAEAIARAMHGRHGDISIHVRSLDVDYDVGLKIHTASIEATIFALA
jgi:hypothetical protein